MLTGADGTSALRTWADQDAMVARLRAIVCAALDLIPAEVIGGPHDRIDAPGDERVDAYYAAVAALQPGDVDIRNSPVPGPLYRP